jgi:hypothetical protein
VGVAALVLAFGPLGNPALAAPDHADGLDHFARDVFFIRGVTLRNPDDTTPLDAPLFNVAGVPLESPPGQPLTWGAWTAASATSTAKVQGGTAKARTDVRLDLTGLIPGGRYSIFWGTLEPDSEQPLCPGVERTLPLDAVKPDQSAPDPNSFIVGADGHASYHGAVAANLFTATQVFFSVVYHFFGDASTYPFPNIGEQRTQGPDCRSSFGEDAMRQLLILQKW